jgi:hypothetical protein
MGGACSGCGGEKCILVLAGKPEGRDHLEHTDLEGRIILRWMFREWGWGVDWLSVLTGGGHLSAQ